MFYSTYPTAAYVGVVVVPVAPFGIFYGFTRSFGFALALAIILAIVLTPLQFLQLSRLQDDLDDHGGSIPMGAMAL